MRESARHLIEAMTADTGAYMQTLQHKLITYIGGTSAIYQLRDTLSEYLPSWFVNPVSDLFQFLSSIPWMDFFSAIAVILLIIERFFIVSGKYRAWRRGE